MKTHLKIKICSLAAESKIIRREERKWPGLTAEQHAAYDPFLSLTRPLPFNMRQSLHLHRVNDVRKATRAALLAYGFLRGRTYGQIENKTKNAPDWIRVIRTITQFSSEDPRVLQQRFAEWIDDSPLEEELKPWGVNFAWIPRERVRF